MISEDIRTFLARIFLGKARVHSIGADRRSVSARGIARKVDTRPLRPPQRALGSTLLGAGMEARVKGFSLPGGAFAGAGELVKSLTMVISAGVTLRQCPVTRYEAGPARGVKWSSVRSVRALGRVSGLPLEIRNRLQWHPGKPRGAEQGDSVLALYYPVMENGLNKSIFNKDSGTLLVWYNPLKAWRVRGLLLVRNFSSGSELKWRWTDV